MPGTDWTPDSEGWEERQSRERLSADNERLKKLLGVNDETFFISDSGSPELENQFLRSILDFEEADRLPQRTLRSLLPDGCELPPVEAMTPHELALKLNQILFILEDHNVHLDLAGNVPDPMTYDYLVREGLDHEIPIVMPEGFHLHINGCGGSCPDCFQRPYCETGRDVWPGEEIQADGPN
jgi:hypothetical protein